MSFFDNYIFKTAAVVIILFVSIPLVMPRQGPAVSVEEEEQSQPLGMKGRAAKVFDRISSFYGLGEVIGGGAKDKLKAGGTDLSGASADIYGAAKTLNGNEVELHASAALPRHTPLYERGQGTVTSLDDTPASTDSSYIPLVYSQPGTQKSSIEQRAVTYEGNKYDVLEAHGKKYAITKNGPVELDGIIAQGGVYTSKEAALSAAPNIISREEYAARRSGAPVSAGALAPAGSSGGGGGGQKSGSGSVTGSTTRTSSGGLMLSAAYAAGAKKPAGKSGATYGGSGGVVIVQPAQPRAAPAVPPTQPYMAGNKSYIEKYYLTASTVTVTVPAQKETGTPQKEQDSVIVFNMPKATVGTDNINNVRGIGLGKVSQNVSETTGS